MNQQPRRLMRLPEVMHAVGYRRTAIYDKVKSREFPAPISLGARARAVAWTSDSIEAWIESRVRGQGNAAKAPVPTRNKKKAAVVIESEMVSA
ncbi:MAG: AlpA family phage regulatory protein [Betaproteobacteria bacterium]|nr:AlpA family phage regulatory protein [Betaproteobacteria bacterium]